jgi:nickel transport protein
MRVLAVSIALLSATPSRAHFHMLLPEKHSIKEGEQVVVTYQFGHPFEHELGDAEKPVRAVAFAPDGKSTDLVSALEKVELPAGDGKKAVGYRVSFRPSGRGDFTLVFESPPVWMADEKHFVHDITRVVIHVQTQNGWDRRHVDSNDFTLVPLTRPYGLRPGTVFQALARPGAANVSHLVEVERYNVATPKVLPPDEQITLALKTDPSGVATCTLPDPGWWAVTATRRYGPKQVAPTRERDGKAYPVVERATLWVFVDDQPR